MSKVTLLTLRGEMDTSPQKMIENKIKTVEKLYTSLVLSFLHDKMKESVGAKQWISFLFSLCILFQNILTIENNIMNPQIFTTCINKHEQFATSASEFLKEVKCTKLQLKIPLCTKTDLISFPSRGNHNSEAHVSFHHCFKLCYIGYQ